MALLLVQQFKSNALFATLMSIWQVYSLLNNIGPILLLVTIAGEGRKL